MEVSARNLQREAERQRLIRTARGPRKARGWWTSAALMLSSLLALFVRPQS
jgi:hypothetical protein